MKVVLAIGVIVAAVLAYAATKPSRFRVSRSTTVRAPAETIFALLDDLHRWRQWAPQDRDDAAMQRTFSGPPAGVGAASTWVGTGKSGRGQMVITQSTPPTHVSVRVDWETPFQARNLNDFVLVPQGDSTLVTWSMEGPNLYIMKVMSVVTNMDRVMGQHFEVGLHNLKMVAETGTRP